ncbi:MAG: type II secretion system F family protein [Verrucomicrobia bacterium]|nr:type II secretion system F family protein [Verrucomicrobiota bacterium]
MNEFQYIALTEAGQRINGAVEAESEAAVLRVLEEKKLFPLQVHAGAAERRARFQWRKRKVRNREVGVLYGQMADLIGSGVPLMRALDTLIKSTVSRPLVEILKQIRANVSDGKSLTEAMRDHPDVFPPLHTAMVQAGERAAFLEDVLRSLSEFLERLDELRGKVLGALTYPLLLVLVGVTVMVAALVFFVPRFEPLLAGVKKPMPTELVFFLSTAMRHYGHWMVLGLAGLIALVWSRLRTDAARKKIERWRLKIPVAGEALRLLAITRFCRILGTMLTNGVPLLQALRISKDATGSSLMAERIGEAVESVRDGKRLSEPLSEGAFIPDQILAMITVAEESNKLDKVLLQIADTVERRTNRQVDQAVRLIEPAILCLVAGGIGFLALGLLLPIFTMATALGAK